MKNFNTKNLLSSAPSLGSPSRLHSGYRRLFLQGVKEPEREGNHSHILQGCRSQCPRGPRRRSSAARLLRLWVRIPPGHGYLSVVSVVCCQVEVSAKD